MAHNLKGFGIALADLVQEGNDELRKAAERFDPENHKNNKFSSYAHGG
jgi:DNA-directed RNA polymerase sigma subunit (sigma70/sigma32)